MSILKRENRIVLITGIICVLIAVLAINYTYSFFAVEKTNSSVITGEVESMKLSVTVNRVAPTDDSKLIPQQEEVITEAVTGIQGNCKDGNGNTVCHVYKVTLKNEGSSSALVSGTLVLDNKSNPNLKWARISGLSNPMLMSEKNLPSVTTFVTNEEYQASTSKDYYVVVWINETGLSQTDTGSYTGTITFTTTDGNAAGATGSTFLAMSNYNVGGTTQTTLPKGSYIVTPNCTNATATFDYENYGIRISSLSAADSTCSPTATTKTIQYLNTYIKDELTGQTQGIGQVVNENGYRYEGENPNNYIRFNNELWRIIGVFETEVVNDDGTTETKYLTKIIRNDSIGGFAWDGNKVNIWPTSSLYKILNNYYYTSDNGTESGYCYKYSTTTTGDCDFRNSGINATYRPMVEKVTWYLGGNSIASIPASMYTYERSTNDTYYYSANTSYKTVANYIGLMYASDYGYSVIASTSCPRTTAMLSYNTDACAGQSWLYKDGFEWTITHSTSDASYPFCLYDTGSLDYNTASIGYDTRPVLYLDSTVYILSGDGSKATPYIIAM